MEAICSSETSIDFQRIIQCYVPEDSTLHNPILFNSIAIKSNIEKIQNIRFN
jgi:hypothetical protein